MSISDQTMQQLAGAFGTGPANEMITRATGTIPEGIVTSTLVASGLATLQGAVNITGLLTAAGGVANTAIQSALTALASGGQAGATQLNSGINQISTVANVADSCQLPAATAGVSVVVSNIATANAAAIWPKGASDVVQGFGVTNPLLLAAGYTAEFRCVVAGTWTPMYLSMLPVSWKTNTTTGTFLANQLSGSEITVYLSTATTPGTISPRTGPLMFNDTPNAQVGLPYLLIVGNLSGSANTLTIATNVTGVTVTGTNTIAQNIARAYIVTFNTATTLTIQEMFSFTIAA